MPINILICDPIGLTFDEQGNPDASEVKAHVETKGGTFHVEDLPKVGGDGDGSFHFYYRPNISTRDEILAITGSGQFDALIAAATLIPPQAKFRLGGVRIGAGTGNMGSTSWGGPNGIGGTAPLMNTPGFNARATAQMTLKALLHFRPSLPFDVLHDRVVSGTFDTGKNLREFPTAKLEGQTIAVIGFGNIGREVARLAAAFGMKVKVYARVSHHALILAEGFAAVASLVDAAGGADVISVHTGLGALDAANRRYANQGLIDAHIFQALAKGATILNFDRGECVDAMLSAMRCLRDKYQTLLSMLIFLQMVARRLGRWRPTFRSHADLANGFSFFHTRRRTLIILRAWLARSRLSIKSLMPSFTSAL